MLRWLRLTAGGQPQAEPKISQPLTGSAMAVQWLRLRLPSLAQPAAGSLAGIAGIYTYNITGIILIHFPLISVSFHCFVVDLIFFSVSCDMVNERSRWRLFFQLTTTIITSNKRRDKRVVMQQGVVNPPFAAKVHLLI